MENKHLITNHNLNEIGNNIIICSKYIGGNKHQANIFYIISIVFIVGCIFWNIIIPPFFISEFSFISTFVLMLIITENLLFILSFVYYLLCFFGDPGIIPKNYHQYSMSNSSISDIPESNAPRIYT